MSNYTTINKNFTTYAQQTYLNKKEAVDFLENSFDPFERAIGTLIKQYAGVGITEKADFPDSFYCQRNEPGNENRTIATNYNPDFISSNFSSNSSDCFSKNIRGGDYE